MKKRQRPRWLLPAMITALLVTAVGLIALRTNLSREADFTPLQSIGELLRLKGRLLVFRSREGGADDKRVAAVALAEPNGARTLLRPRCERVAASAKYLVCLARSRDLLRPYQATVFDHDMRELGDAALNGAPSRARVSPDEKYFATTSFVVGDSYADDIFSTRTFVHHIGNDGVSLGAVENIEYYDLFLNQDIYRYPDKNIWGVTFVPGQDRFFATASMSGHRYLVDVSIRDKRMVALRDNVECPSLSPNGLRLAYKRRVRDGQIVAWKFHVLDLATGDDTELGEARSVDDQIAWLDDDNVAYGVPSPEQKDKIDIWTAPINGGPPVMLIPNGDSPTVIGPP